MLAGFLLSLPWMFNLVTMLCLGHGMPRWLLVGLAFPLSVLGLIVAVEKIAPWLYWPCPGCNEPYFAVGPQIRGRDVFVNHFRTSCKTCDLAKWMPAPPKREPLRNLVTFEDLVRLRAELRSELRKQA